MECPVCYDERVDAGYECPTCKRITCCNKCFIDMLRKMCPLCRSSAYVSKWKLGDFGFLKSPDSQLAVRLTYESAMKHNIFDMNPLETVKWDNALFNATESDGVEHSGASWGLAIYHLRKLRDTGSWAAYVACFEDRTREISV